jgi:Family of unknown function (DUF6364)
MTTKLTLTIEDTVIHSAKDYAQKKGKSLSSVVENYLRSLTAKQPDSDDISPRVKKLMGVIKLPEDFDYKKALGSSLAKKYMK